MSVKAADGWTARRQNVTWSIRRNRKLRSL